MLIILKYLYNNNKTLSTYSMDKSFVLVHGSCHGGWCWNKMKPFLKVYDHEIYTPSLTGLGERSDILYEAIKLSTHIDDIVQVFERIANASIVAMYGSWTVEKSCANSYYIDRTNY